MDSLPPNRFALLRRPVPITLGPGSFTPPLVLGALFALVAARIGCSIAAGALFGGIGGTASLLGHELGHVRAARSATGVRALRVSLVWLGAVTYLEGAYASGRDQVRVAVAGPLTSFAIAGSLVAGLYLPLSFESRELVLTLAAFNAAIGIVNLIPASPLDGYRLSVGLLWSVLGSETSARKLFRTIASVWLVVELLGTCILLGERPALGAFVVAIGTCLLVQNRLVRRNA